MNNKKLTMYIKKLITSSLLTTASDDTEEYTKRIKSVIIYIGKLMLYRYYSNENEKIKRTNEPLNLSDINIFLPQHIIDIDKDFDIEDYAAYEFQQKIKEMLFNISDEDMRLFSLGKLYEVFMTNKERKFLGQVYTPENIIDKMLLEGFTDDDIIQNPFYRVIDPACGGGYFLLKAYDRIRNIFEENIDKILLLYPQLELELRFGVHDFILRNNIYGSDIDPFAVFLTFVSLVLKGWREKSNSNPNIKRGDVLLAPIENIFCGNYEEELKFNLVIGNPPYIGHKKIDNTYRRNLTQKYGDVYVDKSDISYCFFKKGYELLVDGGRLLFITSRYFQEAPSACKLREYINEYFYIEAIFDYYGKNVFKGVSISPTIIKCLKSELYNEQIHMYRLDASQDIKLVSFDNNTSEQFKHFFLNQKELDNTGWMLIDENESKLFKKIDSLGEYSLNKVCNSYQGIITGYDQAFIVNDSAIKYENLERSVIRNWIKNSDVSKYIINKSDKYIIYTDLIKEPDDYPNIIAHVEPFRERLANRRECLKGLRKWHELQWGRDLSIFNMPKILFPFKSGSNRFAISYDELLCSADIYILIIKEEFAAVLTLEYLLGFLNSSVFEFYFKSIAKKVGDGLYDYYPNKIMNLKLRIGKNNDKVREGVFRIIRLHRQLDELGINQELKNKGQQFNYISNDIQQEMNVINHYFYELYGLDSNEIGIIEDRINADK